MVILTGNNLGGRQHQLNKKVNDDVKTEKDFNEVKQIPEESDVDKFYKIDIAAKYKNVEYILETFKCGDSLYITRALDKCTWLLDSTFKDIINDCYLSNNIFPYMSIKMRKKLLTTVATDLKDDERAINFHTYCMKMKLYNIALKFLLRTPESFKLNIISTKSKAFTLITEKDGLYVKNFIGNSFSLAECYIKNLKYDSHKGTTIYMLRHFYSLSNEEYLDMLETSGVVVQTFGRRLSKHIVHHYKARVMAKPALYVHVLNKAILARNSTIADAKIFATVLMPERSTQFFNSKYYVKNKLILDLIPADEKFQFIKKIFNDKYPGNEFESCHDFYLCGLHDMMTMPEKEAWALNNISSQNEILGSGKDYLWYEFVSFDKAFMDIKKMIKVTTDAYARCAMLKVLIDSAKNEDELTKLLNYFGDRHINEVAQIKNSFLEKLIKNHTVWRFGEDCWKALEKIFYSLNVYGTSGHVHNGDFIALTVMYHAFNKKPLTDCLNKYIDKHIRFHIIRYYDKKIEKDAETMFQYLLQFYVNKIELLSKRPYEEEIKMEIRHNLHRIVILTQSYEKTKKDVPEIVHTYLKLDWHEFKCTTLVYEKLSSTDIMHYLKENAELVVSQFPKIKSYFEVHCENINWLLLKLKIYFSHDISQKYLIFFNECLSGDFRMMTANVCVRGILTLANDAYKVNFVEKYAPKDKKIDYSKISLNTIQIQQAICRQMHCSRPPLPLSKVLLYVVGDYVQFCLTLFRSYLLNLPHPQCLEFIEAIMDKPISVQKHGLRLAFECFDEEKLITITLDTWKKTKNVSLRMVLYKSLFARVLIEHDDVQLRFFDVLLSLTKDLNADDDDSIFQVEIRELPSHLVGRYLETVFATLTTFPEKLKTNERLENVMRHIENRDLAIFSDDFLSKVIDDHIETMLGKRQILNTKQEKGDARLIKSKWDFTARNLVYVTKESRLKKNLNFMKRILKHCVDMWDVSDESNGEYVIRRFLKEFIEKISSESNNYDKSTYTNLITLLKAIETDLKEALPEKDIYMLIWNLRLNMISKKVLLESNHSITASGDDEQISTDIRKSGILLGTSIGTHIKANVDEGKFFWMFNEQMNSVVSTMAFDFYACSRRPDKLTTNDVIVLFCVGLLEYEIPETFKFALKLLPTEYHGGTYLNDYISVLNKIQSYKNTEIQYYAYEKFVNTDFKCRKYFK